MADKSKTTEAMEILEHPKMKRALEGNKVKMKAIEEILKIDIDRDLKASIVSGIMMGG